MHPYYLSLLVFLPAPYLVDVGDGSAGLGAKVFFIWGTTCLIGFFFTYFLVAEVFHLLHSYASITEVIPDAGSFIGRN